MSNEIDPVLRRRHLVLLVLRATAVVFLIIAIYSFAYPTMRSIQIGRGLQSVGLIFNDGRAWFGTAVGTLIPGVVLVAFSRAIAKWVVPGIRDECAHCGYEIGEHSPNRCPECGARLHRDPAAAQSNSRGES